MKKLLLILTAIVFITGCTDVRTKSYDDVINSSLSGNYKYINIYREGYSYYLPKGLKVYLNMETSDVITDNKYNYYLYVDRISYHNKVKNEYKIVKNAVYSSAFDDEGKSGYLEITGLQNDKYLIEIMYNYAKIEVIVDKDDINTSLGYSIIVLSSIKYNDKIIANLINKGEAEFKEEEYNIFSTVNNDSNVLKFKETYTEEEDEIIPDTDLIN